MCNRTLPFWQNVYLEPRQKSICWCELREINRTRWRQTKLLLHSFLSYTTLKKKNKTEKHWRHGKHINITWSGTDVPQYLWKTILCSLCETDRERDRNQDRWTAVLCTAEKALWQMFTVGKWDLCGASIFLKEKKRKKCKKSVLTGYVR